MDHRVSSLRPWLFFAVAAVIALIGVASQLNWFSQATAEYLEGPIWLFLFLVMAKEFQRLPLETGFLRTVFLCFSFCFLADILIRLPIVRVFIEQDYVEPIVNAGWVVTCLFVLRGLCISVLQAKASEQRWRSMFDAAKDCVFVKDVDLRYRQVNRSMAQTFGDESQLIGRTDTDLLGDASPQSTWEDYQVLSGKSVDSEATILVHDQPHNFHIIKVPIRNAEDEVVGITGIARDITARREVEAQLERTQFSLDHAADLVCWVDAHGTITYANDACRNLVGPARIVEGITAIDEQLFSTGHWDALWERSDHEEHLQYETEFQSTTETSVPMEISAYRFLHQGHDLLCLVGRNISLRKKLQAENDQRLAHLAHLSRVQTAGEMVAGIAHELNQPLATATNYAYTIQQLLPLLAEDVDQVRLDKIRQRVQVVSDESLRAGEIIRRLRSLIHKSSSTRIPTDLHELLQATLHLFSSQWPGKSPVILNLTTSKVEATVDAIQIQQIFLNLLTNARDSLRDSSRAPELRITTESRDQLMWVAFEDNGPGIAGDPEEVFRPFVSSKQDGMGLGLAICRSIAEAHDGQLTAHHGPTGGARFELTLPRFAESVATTHEEHASVSKPEVLSRNREQTP